SIRQFIESRFAAAPPRECANAAAGLSERRWVKQPAQFRGDLGIETALKSGNDGRSAGGRLIWHASTLSITNYRNSTTAAVLNRYPCLTTEEVDRFRVEGQQDQQYYRPRATQSPVRSGGWC